MLIRSFPQGAVIVFDHELRYISAGGLGLADVGLSRGMLEGRTIFEAFPPEVAAEIEPAYRRALAGQETTMDVPFRDRVYLMRLAPVRDEDGEIIAGMGFTQDVTGARASERAQRESEERFRLAFEHAPIGKALIGLDGRYQRVNRTMSEITGYSDAQLQGLTVADVTHPQDLADETAAEARLLAGEIRSYTLEKRYVTATGDVVWVSKSASLMRRDDGSPLNVIAQVQDITERKNHEQALLEERRRLRAAESIGHFGWWELDVTAGVVNWSDTLLALYGIAPGGFNGEYDAALNFIHADDRVRVDDATKACVNTGELLRVRYRVTRPNDGALRWFDARGEAVYEEDRLVRITGAVADVTEQALAEAEVEAARDVALAASRQKSAFLATMSHEIRTPMNAVIGMTGLLLDTRLDIRQREFVETVRDSGDVLLGIINDILDFSKIEADGLSLEHEPFDLQLCVEGSLDLVAAPASAKGLELISHVHACCPTHVVGDITRLRQVLVNLLSNAVKFTEHGEVLLSVDCEESAGAEIRLRFAVADTGIGIPIDRIESLFDAFGQVDASTTRLYGGTGLGLTISKRLVEAMDGIITVRSIVGIGTTFSFSVPLGRCTHAPERLLPQTAATLHGRSALIVDDNPTNRRVLRLQLEGWGMTVHEVASGDAAIAVLDSEVSVDVALLDMTMPRMTGHELARRLRAIEKTKHLPLILLSSRSDPWEAEQHGLFSGLLTKPVKKASLMTTLLQALAADATAPGPAAAAGLDTPMAREPLRVLLAEDNVINQRVAKLMLEKLGQTVDAVATGAEAAEAVARMSYDLVLMDVEMPEMDGLQATRLIRSNAAIDHQPRIVALTAKALTEDRKACAEAGMDDYLTKPLRLADLDRALGRAAAGAESIRRQVV